MKVLIRYGILAGMAIAAACSSPDENPAPTANALILEVKTDSILVFESGQVKVSGSVTSKESFTILEKGICYGTSNLPNLKSGQVAKAGPGFGPFNLNLSNLNFRSTYYLRAFSISVSDKGKTDTTYGNQRIFYGLPSLKSIQLSPSGDDTLSFNFLGLRRNSFRGLEGILAKGICWGTNTLPVPGNQNFVVSSSDDTSGISGLVSGLVPGTLYYFRAFAVNAADTAFGPVVWVTTSFRDPESNLYETVKIGNQIWMRQNLNSSAFSTGDALILNPENAAWDTVQAPMASQVNQNPEYGKYYNLPAITDPRKLCPAGWKIPRQADWDSLFATLGGWTVAGNKLKARTSEWRSGFAVDQGSSGFLARPSGMRDANGQIKLLGRFGFWWAQPDPGKSPSGIRINNLDNEAFTETETEGRGFTIRCLKE